jgi:hypothetical protein
VLVGRFVPPGRWTAHDARASTQNDTVRAAPRADGYAIVGDLAALAGRNGSARPARSNRCHGLEAMREYEDQCMDMHCGNALNSASARGLWQEGGTQCSPSRRSACGCSRRHQRRSLETCAAAGMIGHPGGLVLRRRTTPPRREPNALCYALAARVATAVTSDFTTDGETGVPTFSVSTSASINGPVMKATVR